MPLFLLFCFMSLSDDTKFRWRAVSSNGKIAKLGQKGSCGGHETQFWNIGTPLISRKRLKLESSNLAWRRRAVSSNEKMQNWVKRGHVGSRDPFLGILGPPNISGTVEARNFKFGTETESGDIYRKKCKIGSNTVIRGSRDPILEFWNPSSISQTVGARNFKFGKQTDGGEI